MKTQRILTLMFFALLFGIILFSTGKYPVSDLSQVQSSITPAVGTSAWEVNPPKACITVVPG